MSELRAAAGGLRGRARHAPVDCTVKMKCSLSLWTCRYGSHSSSPDRCRSCSRTTMSNYQHSRVNCISLGFIDHGGSHNHSSKGRTKTRGALVLCRLFGSGWQPSLRGVSASCRLSFSQRHAWQVFSTAYLSHLFEVVLIAPGLPHDQAPAVSGKRLRSAKRCWVRRSKGLCWWKPQRQALT